MHREKGYFRNGRKTGARSNLHNFRKKHPHVEVVVPEPAEEPIVEKPKVEAKKVEVRKPVAKKVAKKNV